jgi:hypothetical protein
MSKPQKLTVSLPNRTPAVTLPRHLGKTLEQVIASGTRGISTMKLIEAGCLNPAKAISTIKKQGALILKELKDTEDSKGEVHPRVAHYYYLGWQPDAVWPETSAEIDKDFQ